MLSKIQKDLLIKSGCLKDNSRSEKIEKDAKDMFRRCLKDYGYDSFNRPQFDNAYMFFKRHFRKLYPQEINNHYVETRISYFISDHEDAFNNFLGEPIKEKDRD